jgi:hypothetical protein
MIALLFAAALIGVDRPIVSGADFLEACAGGDSRQQIACTAYFSAVVATADAFHAQSFRGTEEGEHSFICPAPGTDVEAAALSAIQQDPDSVVGPAPLGILSGLLDAFPCDGPAPEPAEPDAN